MIRLLVHIGVRNDVASLKWPYLKLPRYVKVALKCCSGASTKVTLEEQMLGALIFLQFSFNLYLGCI